MKTMLFLSLISIFVIVFCSQSIAKDSFPAGANESLTFYFTPDWLNNDEVIYIKRADYYKRSSSIFAQFDQTDEVFVKREAGVYAYNINTDKTRLIKPFEKEELDIEKLSSAKNGTKIALVDTRGRLYIMNKDGSDFKMIFFKKDRTKHLDGSPALVNGSYKVGVHQAWISPDGTKILYSIGEVDSLYESETWKGGTRQKLTKTYSTSQLWIINSDGTENRVLMDGAMEGAWYPDGNKFWVWLIKGGYCQIDINGNLLGKTELGKPTAISPNGDRRWSGGWPIGIYKVVDGKEIKIKDVLAMQGEPVWSPDSTKILCFTKNFKDIAVIDKEGSGFKKLTGN
ncbi:MAG: hypothetical protein WC317_06080 [Candidatus Omnitrophota bacterium]|jgi:hypothetical protein